MNFTTDQLSHISQDNVIEMYSTHNEEKFVVSEMFTKNVYIDKLDNIVDK